jgi:hypothetical protein
MQLIYKSLLYIFKLIQAIYSFNSEFFWIYWMTFFFLELALYWNFFFWNLGAIGSFIPTGWASIFYFHWIFFCKYFSLLTSGQCLSLNWVNSIKALLLFFFSSLSVSCLDFSAMLIIFGLMLLIQSIAFFSKQFFHISLFPLFFLRMDSFEIFLFFLQLVTSENLRQFALVQAASVSFFRVEVFFSWRGLSQSSKIDWHLSFIYYLLVCCL